MHDTENPANAADARPSRSARRRDALDVLALARQLSELPPARRADLALPDAINAQITVVRRTPSHIAHKRELLHLAKLMRADQDESFATARAALANDRTTAARHTAALHRAEALRTTLLDDTAGVALTALIAVHPDLDRQRLRALLRQARRERDAGKSPRAQRELFRLLRDLDSI